MTDRILVIDPDTEYRERLARELREEGVDCRVAPSVQKARAIARHTEFTLVISDATRRQGQALPMAGAPENVVRLVPENPGSVRKADGGEHTLAKVSDPTRMAQAIHTLLRKQGRRGNRKRLKRTLRHPDRAPEMIVGDSSRMAGILDIVQCASDSKCTLLITGESGTGKEVLARAIHENTPATARSRFVGVNCAAIPDHLLESELFGHVKGAFTGATTTKEGLFESARGGTIFLDEIGEMSLPLQARLLRVLQEKEIRRVGSVKPVTVDMRVICSTNRDLDGMVREGTFRDDLFYRINVLEIHLPPLRERRDEIPSLVDHFIRKFNEEYGFACPGVDLKAMNAIQAHDWRGNIRELSNVLERALLMGRGEVIREEHLPARLGRSALRRRGTWKLREALGVFEREHIRSALSRSGGNRTRAAKLLGISVSTLYRRMKQLGIRPTS